MSLRLERDGTIARLLIDRPARRNAMTQAMWEELPVLVAQAMADDAVRVLILGSATPGIFCAGADIGEFARHSSDEAWRIANQAAIRASQYAKILQNTPPGAIFSKILVGLPAAFKTDVFESRQSCTRFFQSHDS